MKSVKALGTIPRMANRFQPALSCTGAGAGIDKEGGALERGSVELTAQWVVMVVGAVSDDNCTK